MLKDEIENYKKIKRDYNKLRSKYKSIENAPIDDDTILKIQNLYIAGKKYIDAAQKITPIVYNQKIYKSDQKSKIAKGRAERQHRTHQLIFIGCLWDNFLRDNNLSDFYDVNFFTNVLNKIAPKVNVAEEYLFFENENFDLPVAAYNGRDKNIIHRYCRIGGAWESFFRHICKNDVRDKTAYLIHRNYNAKQIQDVIRNNKPINNYPICNKSKCKKIGFVKNHCLKLDEKFFYLFLRQHKNEIIDAIVHP